MSKRAAVILLILLSVFPAHAQFAWCGYALIEGLPLLENQLAVIASLTPQKNDRSQPHELFQYRFNLDHTAVIIEGCFQAEPRREVVASLLEQTVEVSVEAVSEVPVENPLGGADLEEAPRQVEPPTVREYVDQKLVYSLFAPGGTREESAAAARAYLAANIKAWEVDDPF